MLFMSGRLMASRRSGTRGMSRIYTLAPAAPAGPHLPKRTRLTVSDHFYVVIPANGWAIDCVPELRRRRWTVDEAETF
jgi:hypothetical protein